MTTKTSKLITTLELTQQLIAKPSLTPNDAGCQLLLAELLEAAGFHVEHLNFENTHNLWATHTNNTNALKPILCFAGHTDVVPEGNLEKWDTNPFEPTIKNNYLYGRGAADMKGGLAAMVIAAIAFVKKYPNHHGTLAFLITSDEEGKAEHGTRRVLEHFSVHKPDLFIDYCLVGEPSSQEDMGDMIKIGRRGSLSGIVKIKGIQGHVAYPYRAKNPLHVALPALTALTQTVFCTGNDYFSPTTLQITQVNFGLNADNVIPGEMTVHFNLRFSSDCTEKALRTKIEDIFQKQNLETHFTWRLSGLPFLTNEKSPLITATQEAIKKHTNIDSEASTIGGTSDGRFFALYGTHVVELGPVNKTIHQINECVNIDDLETLTEIYKDIIINMLA